MSFGSRFGWLDQTVINVRWSCPGHTGSHPVRITLSNPAWSCSRRRRHAVQWCLRAGFIVFLPIFLCKTCSIRELSGWFARIKAHLGLNCRSRRWISPLRNRILSIRALRGFRLLLESGPVRFIEVLQGCFVSFLRVTVSKPAVLFYRFGIYLMKRWTVFRSETDVL